MLPPSCEFFRQTRHAPTKRGLPCVADTIQACCAVKTTKNALCSCAPQTGARYLTPCNANTMAQCQKHMLTTWTYSARVKTPSRPARCVVAPLQIQQPVQVIALHIQYTRPRVTSQRRHWIPTLFCIPAICLVIAIPTVRFKTTAILTCIRAPSHNSAICDAHSLSRSGTVLQVQEMSSRIAVPGEDRGAPGI